MNIYLGTVRRMEVVKPKSPSGIAKLGGMALCLAGVLVIAFYAGLSLSPINHHRAFNVSSNVARTGDTDHALWIKGTFLMVLANVTWSLWIILQAALLREYPNKLLVTATQCVFSTAQCFVVAVVAEGDFSRWRLRFDVTLLAVLYTVRKAIFYILHINIIPFNFLCSLPLSVSRGELVDGCFQGFVVTGVSYYLQAWCTEMRGPVFLAAWNPLCFVLTIFCSSFLGEIVHLGSILGGALLVGGLYAVLWGKSKEDRVVPCGEMSTVDGSESAVAAKSKQETRENVSDEKTMLSSGAEEV